MNDLFENLLSLFGGSRMQPTSPMIHLERAVAAAGEAHISARRVLAIAVAEEQREAAHRAGLAGKAHDLELRAIEALRAGREDLAAEAAETIATISSEIEASELAAQRFAEEVALARREVETQRRRLSELDRGRRLAKVGHALAGTKRDARGHHVECFDQAEAALAQVMADNHDARAVRYEMKPAAEHLIERMSDAGIGEPVRVRADDVLLRLKTAAFGAQISALVESIPNSK